MRSCGESAVFGQAEQTGFSSENSQIELNHVIKCISECSHFHSLYAKHEYVWDKTICCKNLQDSLRFNLSPAGARGSANGRGCWAQPEPSRWGPPLRSKSRGVDIDAPGLLAVIFFLEPCPFPLCSCRSSFVWRVAYRWTNKQNKQNKLLLSW